MNTKRPKRPKPLVWTGNLEVSFVLVLIIMPLLVMVMMRNDDDDDDDDVRGVEKRTLPFVAQAVVGAPGLAWNSR